LLHGLTGVPQTKDKALDVIRRLRTIAADAAAKQQQLQQQQQQRQQLPQHPQMQPPPTRQQQMQEATTAPKSHSNKSIGADHLMHQPHQPAVDLMDLPITVQASGHAASDPLTMPVANDLDPERQSTLSWLSNSQLPSPCSRETTRTEPQSQTATEAANTEALKPAERLESLLHANAQRLGA